MLEAPVVTGRMGQGVIDGRHRLSVTSLAGYRFWSEADVVLAVGTRLQPQQMNWGMDDDLKIIRIDIDSEELDRQRKPEIGIVGDATATLKALANRLAGHNAKRNGRADHVAETKAQATKKIRDTLAPQIAYLEAMRAALPEDGILVDELTQMGYAARLAYPTYKSRTFLSPGYQGTLGWGYATSLGVKVAKPGHAGPVDQRRRRLPVHGDGDVDGRAERHRRRRRGVQRRRLRQREAHPAAGLQQPHHRLGPAQSGLREARRELRHRRGAREVAGRARRRDLARHLARRPDADRLPGRPAARPVGAGRLAES